MPVKQVTSKKIATKKVEAAVKVTKSVVKPTGLSVPVYSLAGKATGTMSLPKEIFGAKVNKDLLVQALRVYSNNQKSHPGFTKTRGQVKMTSAKWFRQKGTGRARHGAKSAPIFVGGGVAFGPKPRKVELELPKKMKKAALVSALSSRVGDQGVLGVSGLEKATGKTKEMTVLIGKIREIKGNKASVLIVTGEKIDNVVRGVRNIQGMDVLPANQINAYETLIHQVLLVTKDAVEVLGGKK